MERDFWIARWQNNEIGFNQSTPNSFLQKFFPTLGLKSGARVFVPLCGKSIDMLWLVKQGCQVLGVDISADACEAFFKENQLDFKKAQKDNLTYFSNTNITLIAGDLFDLNQEIIGPVDAVYDRAALIALPQPMREKYAQFMKQILPSPVQMLLIVLSYDKNQMPGPPFSVDEAEVQRLYGDHFEIELVYSKVIEEIAAHLKEKGLKKASEQVYLLKK